MNSNDEYFCPNCRAFLNEQPGFSDNHNTWICIECGCCNNIHSTDEALVRDGTFKEKVFARWKKVNPRVKKIAKWALITTGVVATFVVVSKVSKNRDIDEEEDEGDFLIVSTNDLGGENCRWCGSPLIADGDEPDFTGTLRYECSNSDCYGVFFSENGESLLSPDERRNSNANTCFNCGMSLSGGEYTAPWENGNNPDGYIKCPHCRQVNFQWEDD